MLAFPVSRSVRTAAARSSSARRSSADNVVAASSRGFPRWAVGDGAVDASRAALSEALSCFFRL